MRREGEWQVQEAKSRLSAVITAAEHEGPQSITKHGRPIVVVLSGSDYERLALKAKASLLDLLSCPALAEVEIDARDASDVVRGVEL